MTIKEKMKAKMVILTLAQRNGTTASAIRASMQEALDEAWNTSRASPESKATWNEYFPSGKKPSVEEFIVRLSNEIK